MILIQAYEGTEPCASSQYFEVSHICFLRLMGMDRYPMYGEQLNWLPYILCPKPVHLSHPSFAFLEEGIFLARFINLTY